MINFVMRVFFLYEESFYFLLFPSYVFPFFHFNFIFCSHLKIYIFHLVFSCKNKNKNCSISTLVQQSLYFQIWKVISKNEKVQKLYFAVDLVRVNQSRLNSFITNICLIVFNIIMAIFFHFRRYPL